MSDASGPAVVTGGAGGIGRAVAKSLADAGHNVILADLPENADALEDAARGISARAVTANVLVREDVDRLMGRAFAMAAGMPVLVHCVGVYPVTPFLELDDAEWQWVVDTNLGGTFRCCQAFAQRARDRGVGGRIVNISSTASQVARIGIAHYGASKAGVNQLTKVLAIELAGDQVTVNAICPGVVATERVEAASLLTPDEHNAKLAHVPLSRLGTPAEIAAMASFLVSPDAGYITGATMFVDGGYSCGIPRY